VYLVVGGVVLNDELAIENTLGVGSVEDVHSIPKALVWRRFGGRESTKLGVSIGKDVLKVS
jgi:hypothetical protein